MRKRNFLKFSAVSVLALTAIASTGTEAFSQAWPSQPITLVVPFSPGGSNDVLARFLAQELSKSMSQPVVVENRAGAGGSIGAAHVATSEADGYTFLFTSGSIATNAAFRPAPFDLNTAFSAVSRVATAPYVLVTRQDLGASNVQELVAMAKAAPGELNYGTAGIGDSAHLLTELFSRAAGIEMQIIPYPGAADAQVDLAGGRVDMVFTTVATLTGSVAEQLPRIAFTSAERIASAPDVPTIEESGIDFSYEHWWGVLAPSSTDPAIVTAMNEAIGAALEGEEFKAFIENAGAQVNPSTPEVLNELMLREFATWTTVVDELGIRN